MHRADEALGEVEGVAARANVALDDDEFVAADGRGESARRRTKHVVAARPGIQR